jgi:hypothetical protein
LKSKTINALIRDGLEQQTKLEERLALMEGRLKKLEKDTSFDGFAIATLRRVLMNRFGENFAAEFKKEYDDFYFGAQRPPRM